MIHPVPYNSKKSDRYCYSPERSGDPFAAVCSVKSRDKYDAIEEVIRSCRVFDEVEPRSVFLEAVFRRESLESTGIGNGVAVAHGKLPGIRKVIIGLGISIEGVSFDSVDGVPVNLLFVIGSSPVIQNEYLASLSAVMRFVRNPTFRSYLVDMYPDSVSHGNDYETFFRMMGSQDFTSV